MHDRKPFAACEQEEVNDDNDSKDDDIFKRAEAPRNHASGDSDVGSSTQKGDTDIETFFFFLILDCGKTLGPTQDIYKKEQVHKECGYIRGMAARALNQDDQSGAMTKHLLKFVGPTQSPTA